MAAKNSLDLGGDRGHSVAAAGSGRREKDQAGVHPALREPFSGQRTEVLDVIRHDSAALSARDVEDDPVAARNKIIAIRHGLYVVTSFAQQHRYLRRQVFVQEGSHERRACSPAAAAARPRSYSASLSSISLLISSWYSP